jgi:hypothetical protein
MDPDAHWNFLKYLYAAVSAIHMDLVCPCSTTCNMIVSQIFFQMWNQKIHMIHKLAYTERTWDLKNYCYENVAPNFISPAELNTCVICSEYHLLICTDISPALKLEYLRSHILLHYMVLSLAAVVISKSANRLLTVQDVHAYTRHSLEAFCGPCLDI